MLIIGAKGMAQEVLEILSVEMGLRKEEIVFYDDININTTTLFNEFEIINDIITAEEYLNKTDLNFILGLGNPLLRKQMTDKFIAIGGVLNTLVSSSAKVGSYNTVLGNGCQIMQGVIITNDVQLGQGVLVNLNSTISHNSIIGDFTEISCNVSIAGRCTIGKNVFIGSNATLIPDVNVGDNVIIGAGTVVIRDVPSNVTVVGNPGRIL